MSKENENNKMIVLPFSISHQIIMHQLMSGKMDGTENLSAIRKELKKILNEPRRK